MQCVCLYHVSDVNGHIKTCDSNEQRRMFSYALVTLVWFICTEFHSQQTLIQQNGWTILGNGKSTPYLVAIITVELVVVHKTNFTEIKKH